MLLLTLLLTPILGILAIALLTPHETSEANIKQIKTIALGSSAVNFFVSFIIFMFFNLSNNQFQFVQEYYNVNSFDLYLGIDGISIYFVLLTTIIMSISLLSN